MGPEILKQSQTRDRCRILGLQQKHNFGGYQKLEATNNVEVVKLHF